MRSGCSWFVKYVIAFSHCLCSLYLGEVFSSVVWCSQFLAKVREIPGSIPGATRFSSGGSGTGPFSLVRITEELVNGKVVAQGL
jgi:hypothetical protein